MKRIPLPMRVAVVTWLALIAYVGLHGGFQ